MKFVLKPSLEHMALVKICILLWNQNDVGTLIVKLSFYDLCTKELFKWKAIEEIVIDKVPQLSLPQFLKEKVFGVIKPIGMQILLWMRYYRRYAEWIKRIRGKFRTLLDSLIRSLSSNLFHLAPQPAELCWTPQGTVDRKRTAEVLVADESLDIFTRYCLACDCCLQDDIIRLWSKLPKYLKDYDWNNFPVIIFFWSDNMTSRRAGRISYKDAFYASKISDNVVAAEFFLSKLTPQERKECLKDTRYIGNADVFVFLLFKMDEEQQMEVFKHVPHSVLHCFLKWPWQSFFIGVASHMWDFLTRDSYDGILGDIICKIREGCKDFNYQNLFKEFWQKSPSVLKESLFEEIDKSWILQSLFDIRDKENIRLILKDISLTAKKKLIYNDRMNIFCQRYIRENEWDFLEFFIRECLPSKSEMLTFKEEFEKSMYFKECAVIEKHKWHQFFVALMTRFVSSVKNIEKGESNSSK